MTVTLSLAYLAVLTHQRNRQTQSDILRAQSHVLNGLAGFSPTALGSAVAEQQQQHIGFSETAKRRWNSELEGAVRWAQTTDWDGMRESAEAALGRLLRGSETARRAEDKVGREADAAGRTVREAVGGAGKGVRDALEETKARSVAAADAVQAKAGEARAVTNSVVEKGKDMVGRAKATVGLAEQRFESKAESKLLHLSEVEKALSQRYEKSDVMAKSVDEVLRERYRPMDQRDNTQLRGI